MPEKGKKIKFAQVKKPLQVFLIALGSFIAGLVGGPAASRIVQGAQIAAEVVDQIPADVDAKKPEAKKEEAPVPKDTDAK